MDNMELIEQILRVKHEKRVAILAHYYSRPEIQDICDLLGDSLELSRAAASLTDVDIILFCGVNFMAETASVVSGGKKVLVPDNRAGCSLAESIKAQDLIEWKERNPGGVIVSYVNTTADVKAYTDICCTSSNAVKVVESIEPGKKILFLPDKNLGAYLKLVTGREMEIWHGDCCVHERFDSALLFKMRELHPNADILVHPESRCSGDPSAHKMDRVWFYSTSGMVKHVERSESKEFIILTEREILHQMRKRNPEKTLFDAGERAICGQMKRNTLEKVYKALVNESPQISVDPETAARAIVPIKRMLDIL